MTDRICIIKHEMHLTCSIIQMCGDDQKYHFQRLKFKTRFEISKPPDRKRIGWKLQKNVGKLELTETGIRAAHFKFSKRQSVKILILLILNSFDCNYRKKIEKEYLNRI